MKISTIVKSLLIISVVKFSQSQPIASDQPEQANGFSINYSRPAIVLPTFKASVSSNSATPNTMQQGQNYALSVGGTPILGSQSAQLKFGSLLTGNQPQKLDQQTVSYETKHEVPQVQTQVVKNQVVKQSSPVVNYTEKVSVGPKQFIQPQNNQLVKNVQTVAEKISPIKLEEASVGPAQFIQPQNNQLVKNVQTDDKKISPVKHIEKLLDGPAQFIQPEKNKIVKSEKRVVNKILPVSNNPTQISIQTPNLQNQHQPQQVSAQVKLNQPKQQIFQPHQQQKSSTQPQQQPPHPVQEVHVQVAPPSSPKPERSLLTKLVGPPSIGVRAGINLNFS